MSIRRDLVIKVSNGTATLDMPLQIYEKDHGIELRFKLMDYKYKYDKDPENILNSNKEDILEAYTTIVNPRGYELAQINGEVVDDTIKFMIEDSYTDELEELGIYQLQIHVKCTHSEFSIPPVRFEVLERLKGEKVVTDGDDEVDSSDIIDGSTKFVDDETGKLIIQWQKGDTISSVRLNAMVEVINNAVDEEAQRQLNELEREQQELERENRLQAALDSVDARVDESMNEYETRFNALTASQQQDAEVIDARDGETSLKARLDRDVRNPLQVYEDVEGSYITCDSTDGYAKNVELLGNTIQDADNLADIRSVGDKVEDQELYKIDVVSCGKNLFNKEKVIKGMYQNYDASTDNFTISKNNSSCVTEYIKVTPNKTYTLSNLGPGVYYDKDKTVIKNSLVLSNTFTVPSNAHYVVFNNDISVNLDIVQLEEGTVATPYEPYKEDKLTILSPVQLEKVGDVADRLICKDGVWGVEKNVKTETLNGGESWVLSTDNSGTEYSCFKITHTELKKSEGFIVCDRFNYDINSNSERIYNSYWNTYNLEILISNTKLSTQNLLGFIAWLQTNPTTVKYQTTQPSFVPLPHDQQVKLRTFAGKTNISFLTEIEGTIKAQVPKSIGATVNTHTEQIRSLNHELNRVKKLEESTVSTAVTESAFTTVTETTNGYFEDVKLEGKTLVNIMGDSTQVVLGNINGRTGEELNGIGYRDTYCMTNFIQVNNSCISVLFSNSSLNYRIHKVAFYDSDKKFIKQIEKNDTTNTVYPISEQCLYIRVVFAKPLDQTEELDINVIKNTIKPYILEGDHTQNPPEYFEGLKSVGDGVNDVSVKSCNTNLVGYMEAGGVIAGSGNDYLDNSYIRTNYIVVDPQRTYYIKAPTFIEYRSGYAYVYCYAYDMSYLGAMSIVENTAFKTKPKTRFVRFDTRKRDQTVHTPEEVANCDFMVSTNKIINYIPNQSNKKHLLYYNPTTQAWEKPILRQWDSIEKHSDGKYYYHKRSGEVVLNGSEDWDFMGDAVLENTIGFIHYPSNNIPLIASNIITHMSNKFISLPNSNWNQDIECFVIMNNATIGLKISKSKLSTQDVAGFKAWLQANPTTVVYQLAEEKVYECTNLDLITYADETNLIVNSGALNPKTTLKVHSNVGNVVTLLQKKTLKLEESTTTHDRRIAAIETKLETPAVQVEGSYISCDSTDGYAQNVEILGNTIQDAENLEDIRSVGDKVEGQELYEIPVLSIKADGNLFCGKLETGTKHGETGELVNNNDGNIRSVGKYSIRVEGGKQYKFSMDESTHIWMFQYDNKGNYISRFIISENNYIFTVDTNAKYISFNSANPNTLTLNSKIAITEPHSSETEYQEDKLTILSPVQLEKVGDVADRIICKDGVWGVEKNVETLYFKDLKNPWAYPRPDWVNASLYGIDFVFDDYNMTRDSKKCISNKFSIADNMDKILGIDNPNSLGLHATSNNIYITVPIDINTSDTAKEYVKDSYIKYATTQPTFIPLPHDQQVKLRTFAGQTNISFLTEIEGTIKAQVPQSINTTISTHTEQIDNLNKELDKVKKLEESTVSTVVTESDFTTVTETYNGYFEDVKLEGSTLVNLVNYSKTLEGNVWNHFVKTSNLNYMLTPNTEYTLIAYVQGLSKDKTIFIQSDNGYGIFNTASINIYSNGIWVLKATTKADFTNITDVVFIAHNPDHKVGTYTLSLCILEGDHTQNPPSYFEGLMSVGEDVEEVSVKSVNEKRLFDLKTVNQDWRHGTIDTIIDSNNNAYHSCEAFDVSSLRNKQIYIRLFRDGVVFNTSQMFVCVFDENKQQIGERYTAKDMVYLVPSNAKYMRIMAYIGADESLTYIDRDEYCVSLTPIKYDEQLVPHKSTKKPLLYYNPTTQAWEKPILRQWDSIEKHSDGKYYYHKRSGEVVLDGSEEWAISEASYTNVIAFYTTTIFDFASGHNNKNLISDKFATSGYSDDKEGITSNDSTMSLIRIKIKPSKLYTQDVAGLKTWLEANNVTVVYELRHEEVYECINIDLITYENETNFIVNAGAIAPKSTLKIMCNINNVVRELQQKVSNLENYIQHVMIDALNNALDE